MNLGNHEFSFCPQQGRNSLGGFINERKRDLLDMNFTYLTYNLDIASSMELATGCFLLIILLKPRAVTEEILLQDWFCSKTKQFRLPVSTTYAKKQFSNQPYHANCGLKTILTKIKLFKISGCSKPSCAEIYKLYLWFG